jgi:hypothetical protein
VDGCKGTMLCFRLLVLDELCNVKPEFAGKLLTQFSLFRSKIKQDQTQDTHNDRKSLTHGYKGKDKAKLWIWFSKKLDKKTKDAIKDEK